MYYEDEVSDGHPPYLLAYGREEALSVRLDRVYKFEFENSQKEPGEVTLTYRVQRFFRVMRGFHEVRVPPPIFMTRYKPLSGVSRSDGSPSSSASSSSVREFPRPNKFLLFSVTRAIGLVGTVI